MRAYGQRKTRTRIAGHQDCGVCHSDNKPGHARARREAARESHGPWFEPIECGDFLTPCPLCDAPPAPLGTWVYPETLE
jgi:hypothetical protein